MTMEPLLELLIFMDIKERKEGLEVENDFNSSCIKS